MHGITNSDRFTAAIVAVLLIAATVVGTVAVGSVAAQTSDDSPVQMTHDMRGDAYVSAWNESELIVSEKDNTEVEFRDDIGTKRLTVTNPNGYAVEFDIRIDAAIVDPAELGEVGAVNYTGETEPTADWVSYYPLDGSEAKHTRITVTLQPGQTAEFAPLDVRRIPAEFVADRKGDAEGIIPDVDWPWESDLEKREYTLSPERGDASKLAVGLTDNETDRRVEDYIAEYSTDGGDTWHPVTDDENEAVYLAGEYNDRVEFYFNDRSAQVRVTLNPTTVESLERDFWRGYASGVNRILDGIQDLPVIGSNDDGNGGDGS